MRLLYIVFENQEGYLESYQINKENHKHPTCLETYNWDGYNHN